MEVKIPHANDYKMQALASSGRYYYSKLNPETAIGALNNSTQETKFETPMKSFNLSKSYLKFDVIFAPEAKTTYAYANNALIASANIKTNDGQPLGEINNVPMYSKAILPYCTSYDEFIDNPPIEGDALLTGVKEVGHYPHRDLKTVIKDTLPRTQCIHGDDGKYQEHTKNTNAVADVYQSVDAAALALRFRIPFSSLKSTIFCMDKDVYWGQNLQITVNFNSIDKVGFEALTNDPSGGTPAVLDAGVTISNLKLHMALCNAEVDALCKAKYASSGFQFKIPYIKNFKRLFAAATGDQMIDIKITPSMGESILRIASAVTYADETKNKRYNTNNSAQNIYTHLRTHVNAVPQQNEKMVVADRDLYSFMQEKIKKTAVATSALNVMQNQIWYDDFTAIDNLGNVDKFDFFSSGMAINSDIIYSFEATMAKAQAYVLHTFAVLQKTVTASPEGIYVSTVAQNKAVSA